MLYVNRMCTFPPLSSFLSLKRVRKNVERCYACWPWVISDAKIQVTGSFVIRLVLSPLSALLISASDYSSRHFPKASTGSSVIGLSLLDFFQPNWL